MSETKLDTITEAAIVRMVDGFYARVRRDAELGPVFDRAIAEAGWPAHLERMYRFWSSVMLTSGRYSGDPVGVHRQVSGIAERLFPRWLALFEANARDLFTEAIAARFVEKAGRIAWSLQTAIFHRLGAPPDVVNNPERNRRRAPPPA
jgi:hemoglobin